MSAFTCITCRVGFLDGDLQRGHYKTDWHRYNLKRKVADLPPVTADTFQQKIKAIKEQQAAEITENETSVCEACRKHFSTKNAYENHIQSKKHKDTIAKQQQNDQSAEAEGLERQRKDSSNTSKERKQRENQEKKLGSRKDIQEEKKAEEDMEDSDADSCESWDEDEFSIEQCLFCNTTSEDIEKNLNHMTLRHGFFIPDVEYLTDAEGLLTYLGEKVGTGHVCLWCNEKGKSFLTTQAVQKHMIDKCHCKMLYEGDATYEYTDYYDYRSSYPDYKPDEDADMETERGLEDIEMEVVDEEEEVDEQELQVEEEGYQLVLPSGATVGHRSLQRYYKQNLPHRTSTSHTKAILPSLLAQYKALGWTGATGEVAKTRAKDLAYMQRMKNRHYMRLGCKANKFQRHFRDDNFGI